MIGELQAQQLLALAADGMPSAEIAAALGVDEAIVKLTLARHSQIGERDVTDDDLRRLRAHAVELAFQAEDESVQAKMTQWLIDRDKPKKVETPISPIVAINQAILQMSGSYADMLKQYMPGSATENA